MQSLTLKPTHKLVTNYYEVLGQFGQLNIDHEMAVRSAFQTLLAGCGRQFKWTLVPEYTIHKPKAGLIKVDGALIDTFHLARGYWEAKDEHDDLEKEIRAKFERGYPRTNIIFQAPERAILYQNGVRQGLDEDLHDSKNLVELLKVFFEYREPHRQDWDDAVEYFEKHIPQIAEGVKEKIDRQMRINPHFVERFDAFYELCRQSINPNLAREAVEKMLVQHLMTERIFRRIFKNPDFAHRNVIAIEIEKVITSMTEKEFSRDAFLQSLDHFYRAIESAAEVTEDYSEKQRFINDVYQRFFQGYSPKEADTHGIVYTPQPIVDFMVRSVEDILKKEFGRSLSDNGVHILDPFVGTGNFITRVMKEIRTSALPYKYENELHCNEVMLLPYYVASMNIEHEYMERTGEYKPFPGICLVDTFELAEPEQTGLSFMTEENTERVKRQKEAPIFVIVGNPPYNAGQVDESDNNKNRKYPIIDARVSETYGRGSQATLLRKLQDPYIKAIRWATDRIGAQGLVCFVTNSSFIDDHSLDGVRASLASDFDQLYVFDLGGNVRKNPKLSGTTHNVFGIQVGVSISVLVRKTQANKTTPIRIRYAPVDPFWRKEQKYDFLNEAGMIEGVNWAEVQPDENHTWLTKLLRSEFGHFIPVSHGDHQLFNSHSLGISTNRDAVVYGFQDGALKANVESFIQQYSAKLDFYRREQEPMNVDAFADHGALKWSRNLKRHFMSGDSPVFSTTKIRQVLYRPYTAAFMYLADILVDEPAHTGQYAPAPATQNILLCLTGPAADKPFCSIASQLAVDLHLVSPGCGTHCFPFYTYDEDGSNRRENITDWALNEFRTHYRDPNITKWDIFHYVYAVLHHPEYRARYAANLKRELPHIPFVESAERGTNVAQDVSPGSGVISEVGVPSGTAQNLGRGRDDNDVFRAFATAGARLADLHVNYEQQTPYPLERVEEGRLDWRVEKMRLNKDKTTLVYNDFLTLKGIPPETYEYRLGNRSALEWVIDQYQVSTDKRSGIVNDPNRADDPEYIVRLVGQVITVSLETMKIVKALPPLAIVATEQKRSAEAAST